jgi:hypothetical protein
MTDVTFGHAQWSDPPHDPPQMSVHILFRSLDFVTSGQKALLGRIWRNFRLRMRKNILRMTESDVSHVIGSDHVRKYVLRMRNRKLPDIRRSGVF